MARITVLARQAFFLLTPFTGRRRRSRRRCRLTFVGAAGREKLVQDVKLEAVQVNVRVARRVEAAEAPERGSARLLELESRSPISTEGGTSGNVPIGRLQQDNPKRVLGDGQLVPQKHVALVVRAKGQRDRVEALRVRLVVGHQQDDADEDHPSPRRAFQT